MNRRKSELPKVFCNSSLCKFNRLTPPANISLLGQNRIALSSGPEAAAATLGSGF